MLKKIMASMLVFGLCFAPVAHVFDNNAQVASAKSYKSGKKSYNAPASSNSPSLFKKDKDQQTNKQKTTANSAKKSTKGGLLKGLFIGGAAGLLFGSLLGNLGVLGSILGFAINMIVIVAIVMVIWKIVKVLVRNKRKEQDAWNR